MRALAMTGMETASMMPLTISAIPRLTREVPVAGTLVVVSCADKTVPLPGVSCGCWVPAHVTGSRTSREHRQFVIDLERLRELGMAGQPQQTHAWLPPHPAYVSHGVVEEPAGQFHPLVGCGHSLQHRSADGLVLSQPAQRLFAEGQLEGLGQVALDGFTRSLIRGVGLERVGRRAGKQESACRVQGTAVCQLERGLGAAHQLGVEDTERAFDPSVQPIESGGAVRDVPCLLYT